MISICIPIYNTNVKDLVLDLLKQAADTKITYEILLLDDASTNEIIKKKNKTLTNEHILYFENQNNIGLARTRNKLGELATQPYLLFIDSDAGIVKENYLENYIKNSLENTVIFGGCVYVEKCPSPELVLRWKYGRNREEGIGKYFSCFNFFIPRKLFLDNQFDHNLKQYGYEDTLFGLKIKNKNTPILFIDNPLRHNGLDTTSVYLSKIRLSIENLIIIESQLKTINQEHTIKLLRLYQLTDKLCLTNLISTLFSLFKSKIEINLNGKKPNLWLLDFYKLGYLCKLKTHA